MKLVSAQAENNLLKQHWLYFILHLMHMYFWSFPNLICYIPNYIIIFLHLMRMSIHNRSFPTHISISNTWTNYTVSCIWWTYALLSLPILNHLLIQFQNIVYSLAEEEMGLEWEAVVTLSLTLPFPTNTPKEKHVSNLSIWCF